MIGLKHLWTGALKGWKHPTHAGSYIPHERNGWLRGFFFHCNCLHCDPPVLKGWTGVDVRKFVENHTPLFDSHRQALLYWSKVWVRGFRIRRY